MLTREEIIQKIEKQGGWANAIDSYIICSIYTDMYGSHQFRGVYTIEDELNIMYDRIKNKPKKINYVATGEKECSRCNETKDINDFHLRKQSKDGRKSECKDCSNEYQRKYKNRI